MSIAAIIIGIDGWDTYTLPLVESIREHEPNCRIVVVDNASEQPYPQDAKTTHLGVMRQGRIHMIRTERLCYSAAINAGKSKLYAGYEWYIVLSNDVLCTGPFVSLLRSHDDGDLVGPKLKVELGWPYLEGWCVASSCRAWDAIGGWDERFLGSDYEDVAYSTRARQRGFGLVEDLPFVHLDQRQRYTIVPDFAGKNAHNRELFLREYAGVTA